MVAQRKRSDRGISKTFGALVIISLLGFAVLAVNGGMILFQKQMAQGAANAASLAGALALTQGYNADQIEYAVVERAREQGYDSQDLNTSVDLTWLSEVVGASSSYSNNLHVTITTEYTSLFSWIFNSDQNQITVDAVAHARIQEDLAPGYAIVSLNDEKCQDSANDNNSDAKISGTGCWQDTDASANSNPIPVSGSTQVALADVPLPDCSGLPDYGEVAVTGALTLQPGRYDSITVRADASLKLSPGLYCIYGTGLDDNAFFMSDYSWTVGQDVMVYLMEGAGNFQTSSTSAVYLYASEYLVDQSGQQWAGMLIYAHPDSNSNFMFTGTSKSTYRGTIYAPGARCEAQGTSGFVTLKSQMVCDTVRFLGVNGLYVSYDMSTNYHLPEIVEIMD